MQRESPCSNTAGSNCRGTPLRRASSGLFKIPISSVDRVWSQKLFQKLRTLRELTDVSTDLRAGAPRVKVTINRDQAARFSISPQTIDDTLNDAYSQGQVAQYSSPASNGGGRRVLSDASWWGSEDGRARQHSRPRVPSFLL